VMENEIDLNHKYIYIYIYIEHEGFLRPFVFKILRLNQRFIILPIEITKFTDIICKPA